MESLKIIYYVLGTISAMFFALAIFNGSTYGWKRWRTIVNFVVALIAAILIWVAYYKF